MDDPIKEFKYIADDINDLDLSNITDKDTRIGVQGILTVVRERIETAIENYEKAHTEQNSPTTIDFGESLPWILQEQAK